MPRFQSDVGLAAYHQAASKSVRVLHARWLVRAGRWIMDRGAESLVVDELLNYDEVLRM